MRTALQVIAIALALWCLVLYFWAIVDIARRTFEPRSTKWIWLAIVLFTYSVGPVVYHLTFRPWRLTSR